MSAQTKYLVSTLSMLACLFIAFGFVYLTGNRFLGSETHEFDTLCIVYLCLAVAFGIATVSIQKIQQGAREDVEGEKTKAGKGKSYKTATKSERDAIDKERLLNAEKILPSVEFKSLIKEGSKDPEKDLNELIGIEEVKGAIGRLEAEMRLFHEKNRAKKKKDRDPHPPMNMCFLGSAGTGKTTAVSILVAYLFKYGFIKKNEFISIDGNYLKSGIDPLEKTAMLLARARGSVVFIDEAYALVKGGRTGGEVLATIINEMENHREDLILIFAGYKREMKELFDENSGLASRIKNVLFFEDYNVEELGRIFTLFVNRENHVISSEAMERFESLITRKRTADGFANARTVRNIAEKSVIEHTYYFGKGEYPDDQKYILQAKDIVADEKREAYGI